MKRFFLPVVVVMFIAACNNDKKHAGHNSPGDEPKTLTDSLMKEIDDGHIVGMSKMGKLHNTQKDVQRVIDSIGKLPAAAQQAAASYTEGLKSVIKDLEYANFAMDKWMPEYYANTDTLSDNNSERIKYLEREKIKVTKLKEAILTSLQKADSLLKAKF